MYPMNYLHTPLLSVSLIWFVKWSNKAAFTVLYHFITSAILLSSEWIFDLNKENKIQMKTFSNFIWLMFGWRIPMRWPIIMINAFTFSSISIHSLHLYNISDSLEFWTGVKLFLKVKVWVYANTFWNTRVRWYWDLFGWIEKVLCLPFVNYNPLIQSFKMNMFVWCHLWGHSWVNERFFCGQFIIRIFATVIS